MRRGVEAFVLSVALAFVSLFLCTLGATGYGWLYWCIVLSGGGALLICVYLAVFEEWRWVLSPPVLISLFALTDWVLRFYYSSRLI